MAQDDRLPSTGTDEPSSMPTQERAAVTLPPSAGVPVPAGPPDEARPDGARPDGARPDEARPDGTRDASLDQAFDRDALVALRSAVAAHGGSLGLGGDRLELLVVVAHELASNAVRHGGGRGRLRLWRARGTVYCRVSDDGPGLPDPDPTGWRLPPPVYSEGGRGLYFVQALADEVSVDTNGRGTAVTVGFRLA